MNRHLAAFAKPYESGTVPFLIVEPVTDGSGAMVDLICRYANRPAMELLLLQEAPDALRFSRYLSAAELAAFAPLGAVAFSGSSAAVDYTTIQGNPITFIGYQLLYGTVGCILNVPMHGAPSAPSAPPRAQEGCQAVVELLKRGVRCLSFTDRLEALTGMTRRELYQICGEDFTAIAVPDDRAALLQCLRDAGRSRTDAVTELRLLRRNGSVRWVRLELQPWLGDPRRTILLASLTDIHDYRTGAD